MLRYRTGDITRMLPDGGVAGRHWTRIARLTGRADDMLIIRGINVYPREIEAVLMDDLDVGTNYAIVVDRRGPMVELRIRAEATANAADRLSTVRDRVAGALADRIRIRADLELVPEGSMPRTEVGKVKRVHEQVDDVHHVHVWAVDSTLVALSAHVVVAADTLHDAQIVAAELEARLAEQGVAHATLALECHPCQDAESRDC